MDRDESGRFASGNPGKPKGSVSFMQRTCRAKLWEWLEPQLENLDKITDDLSPKERAKFIARVIPFFLPRQIHAEIELPGGPVATIDYSRLDPDTLKKILEVTIIQDDTASED